MEKIPKSAKDEAITIRDTITRISDNFHTNFDPVYDYWIVDVFSGYVIVNSYRANSGLLAGEYFKVPYTITDGGVPTFSSPPWEKVELEYTPSSTKTEAKKYDERKAAVKGVVTEGTKIKAIGITADTKNLNGRVYPSAVLKEAVSKLQPFIKQSNGQGRVLGLIEHPKKGETADIGKVAIKWESVAFNESTKQVELEGTLLPNTCGNDLKVLAENGIEIGISQRAFGSSIIDKDGTEIIVKLDSISGYDAVLNPSDLNGSITDLLESRKELEMNKDELKTLLEENKDIFADLLKGIRVDELNEANVKLVENIVRSQLKLNENDDIQKRLTEMRKAEKELAIKNLQESIAAKIDELTKDLKYGDLNSKFIESVKSNTFDSVEAATKFIEAKRVEYDAIVAQLKLAGMGFNDDGTKNTGNAQNPMANISVKPVFEVYTGQPEFVKVSHILRESMQSHGLTKMVDLSKASNKVDEMAAKNLKAFDTKYQHLLIAENRQYDEAATTADVTMPYTALRTIIAEMFPRSVALGIFNVGQMTNNPERMFYETFTMESGFEVVLAAAAFSTFTPAWTPAAKGQWKDLPADASGAPIKMVKIGTVVFSGFEEITDYIVDHYNGRIYTVSDAFAAAADTTTLALTYDAIRRGEMQPMERVKQVTSYRDITCMANRLAVQVSDEGVRFPKAQLGYDMVARALDGASKFMARNLDKQMFYQELSRLLTIANNTETYSKSNVIDNSVNGFTVQSGLARLKLKRRYYDEDMAKLIVGAEMFELMSNSALFNATNSRPDYAMAGRNGHVGFWKGMAVYNSTEHTDAFAEVVHPDLMYYRVFSAVEVEGIFPTFAGSGDTTRLVAAKQYTMQQYDSMDVLRGDAGSVIKITN